MWCGAGDGDRVSRGFLSWYSYLLLFFIFLCRKRDVAYDNWGLFLMDGVVALRSRMGVRGCRGLPERRNGWALRRPCEGGGGAEISTPWIRLSPVGFRLFSAFGTRRLIGLRLGFRKDWFSIGVSWLHVDLSPLGLVKLRFWKVFSWFPRIFGHMV